MQVVKGGKRTEYAVDTTEGWEGWRTALLAVGCVQGEDQVGGGSSEGGGGEVAATAGDLTARAPPSPSSGLGTGAASTAAVSKELLAHPCAPMCQRLHPSCTPLSRTRPAVPAFSKLLAQAVCTVGSYWLSIVHLCMQAPSPADDATVEYERQRAEARARALPASPDTLSDLFTAMGTSDGAMAMTQWTRRIKGTTWYASPACVLLLLLVMHSAMRSFWVVAQHCEKKKRAPPATFASSGHSLLGRVYVCPSRCIPPTLTMCMLSCSAPSSHLRASL